MEKQKLSWQEMKEKFRDEWLLITDYEVNSSGHLISGVVARHSKNKEEVYQLPALNPPAAFKYTGESTFPGGWRTYAERHKF